jgi:hypothetical protein
MKDRKLLFQSGGTANAELCVGISFRLRLSLSLRQGYARQDDGTRRPDKLIQF